MALHDYHCLDCEIILRDQYRSIQEGAQARPPACPLCTIPMAWIPQVGRFDTFTPFEACDGQNKPVVIDSLRKLRQVERESEKMARDGNGQHITWRLYSQDSSNRLVNTHGPDPAEAPTEEAKRRFSPLRHGENAPDRALGPAVTDANTSALGSL